MNEKESLFENGSYCLYLRKSRSDVEAEAHGEGETLARHEHILLALAKKMKISISAIYKEVVSGETISARPVMQQLLHEVEAGLWDGVLVVEVERLARGDTIDQGVVSRAFQYSNTYIITPMKVYNPNNEFDEEYFEFGLFMSRREYKTIKRRLNNGRISSVNEGKYLGNIPPYGYERVKLKGEKGFTLSPVPDQADVVRMIFTYYVNGMDGERIGVSKIVRRLNDLAIPAATGGNWVPASVQGILTNPVYIGKVRWNCRKSVKSVQDGQIITTRPRSHDYILKDGLHPAIITKDVFNAAQAIRAKNPPRPVNSLHVVRNSLSGLVRCSRCGRLMVRRPYSNSKTRDSLLCPYTDCATVSSVLEVVEKKLVEGLAELVKKYKMNTKISLPVSASGRENILQNLEQQLLDLKLQKTKQYDFLEQGIYTTDIFLERSKDIATRIEQTEDAIASMKDEIKKEQLLLSQRNQFIPRCQHLLSIYWDLDAATRNNLLKELIDHVDYTKDARNPYGQSDLASFKLDIYPKIQ